MPSPTSHERLRALLAAYALGALPEDEAREVRAHVSGCLACRRELARLQRTAAGLGAGGERAPAEVRQRVWGRLRRMAARRRRRRPLEVVEDDEAEGGPET